MSAQSSQEDRELWFVGPGKVELRVGQLAPSLADGQVLVRGLYSGISQGTETLLYRGEGPEDFDRSLFDGGTTSLYPRRYGYSWVGEVLQSRAPTILPGQRIFCLRPHGDRHVIDVGQLRVLPDDIPSVRATLAASFETVLNVVWDAGIALGDQVVVMGAGIVGLLVVYLAKRAGAFRVRVVEPSSRRREAAVRLGADVAITPADDEPRGEADVVIEATGDPHSLDRAILHAGEESTVLVASFYGERRAPVGLGVEFHRRRLQLKASQVSRLPATKGPRWNADRRWSTVLALLTDQRLDDLLDPPVPFAEAESLFARLAANSTASLQTTFAYGPSGLRG
jgi:2-desacetyl-2-hydroxyethyl bacteriochlorophyllide A dehydrogenase